ncbi:MAG: hypothetical protein AAFV96_00530 [Pseudomonadota bacterium]
MAVTILAGVAAIAAPRFLPSQTRVLMAEGRDVLAFLRRAQTESVATGQRHTVRLSVDPRGLTVEPTPAKGQARLPLTSAVRLAAPLVFYHDGLASGGPVLLASSEIRVRLSVEPVTGQLTLEREEIAQ